MSTASRLETLVSTYPSLLVGFSGGVDSSLLAVVARTVLGKSRTLAVIGWSPSFASQQFEQALDVARRFDLEFMRVPTDEFTNDAYVANPVNRCYHCKTELWGALTAVARDRGIAVVADGTNAEDLGDHRPGLRAAAEYGVRSPLAEAGYSKDDVRREARALGIPIWNAPAAPCLSSRVMYGLSVTPRRVRQVERGESFLRELGVTGDLRVRHRDDEARIEVHPSQFECLRRHRDTIVDRLRSLGFQRVTLDLRGYGRGRLLEEPDAPLEVFGESMPGPCVSS
jgi:uncharacterized protein